MSYFKKLTAGISTAAIMATSLVAAVAPASAATSFTDAGDISSWAVESVNDLVDAGVMSGNPDGSFNPKGALNRAEMAKIATEGAGYTIDTTGAPHFNDVAEGDWFFPYVETLYNNGVVGGINGGALDANGLATYAPANTLNRAEGSKILVDAFDFETAYVGTPPNFPDVAKSAWYYDYVETAYAHGILGGYQNGKFGPADPITREQVAVITESSREEAGMVSGVEAGSKRRAGYTAGAASSYVAPTDPTDPTDPDTPVASDGALHVALSPSTPQGTTVPAGASSIPVAKFDFTASSDDVTISSIVVHKTGISAATNIENAYLYDGTNRLTSGKTVNNTTDNATFNGLNYRVASGTTASLTLKIDTATSVSSGDTYGFEIVSADAISTNAASISGSFPVVGETFQASSTQAGSITIAGNGTVSNPNVGADNVTIAKFKLTAGSTEAGLLEEIALIVDGTVSADAVQNARLYQDGTELASVSATNNKDLLTFDLSTAFEIPKGATRNFEVKADLNTGRNGDTLNVYLDEETDLLATGDKYGFGLSVTNTYDGSTTASTNMTTSTLQGGDVTFSSDGPTSADVAINGDDVELLNFNVTSVNEINIERFAVGINSANGGNNDAGLINNSSSTDNFTDIKIVNRDSGEAVMGPVDVSSFKTTVGGSTAVSGTSTLGYYVFTDTLYMQAGDSLDLSLQVDIENNSALAAKTVIGSLEFVTSGTTLTYPQIKDLNNKNLTTSDVVPSSTITGKTMTMVTSSLTAGLAATPVSDTYVKGSSNICFTGVTVKAGDASYSKITDMTVTGWLNAASAGYAASDQRNLKNYVGALWLEYNGEMIGSQKSVQAGSASTTASTAAFSSLNFQVPAGETRQVDICGNVSSDAAAAVLAFGVAANTDITAEDKDSNTVSVTGAPVNGAASAAASKSVEATITSAGTLTVAEDNSPNAAIVIAGMDEVSFAQYKLTASNEDFSVRKLTVSLQDANGNKVAVAKNITAVQVNYENKDGESVTASGVLDSSGYAQFSDLDIYVEKDSTASFTVSANLNTIASGADSGEQFRIFMYPTNDANNNFETVGQGSGTTLRVDATYNQVTLPAATTTSMMVLRKTAPTVATKSGLSTSLINGEQRLYGFTIAADAKADVALKKVVFNITGSVLTGALGNTITGFKFYKGSSNLDDDTSIAIANNDGGCASVVALCRSDGAGGAGTQVAGTATVTWDGTKEGSISSGSSETYYIRATVANAGTNSAISTLIPDDTGLVTDDYASIAALAGGGAAQSVSSAVAADGVGNTMTCSTAAADTGANVAMNGYTITISQNSADTLAVTNSSKNNIAIALANATAANNNVANVQAAIRALGTLANGAVMTNATCTDTGTWDGNVTGAVINTATGTFSSGAPAGATSNFVWSDNSAIPHSTTSYDWTNGYLVDDLATDPHTLSY